MRWYVFQAKNPTTIVKAQNQTSSSLPSTPTSSHLTCDFLVLPAVTCVLRTGSGNICDRSSSRWHGRLPRFVRKDLRSTSPQGQVKRKGEQSSGDSLVWKCARSFFAQFRSPDKPRLIGLSSADSFSFLPSFLPAPLPPLPPVRALAARLWAATLRVAERRSSRGRTSDNWTQCSDRVQEKHQKKQQQVNGGEKSEDFVTLHGTARRHRLSERAAALPVVRTCISREPGFQVEPD